MENLGPHAANSTPLTPLGFLDRAAIIYGDSLSIVYGSNTFTWSETRSRCLQLASAFKSVLNISTGDVISVVAPNVPAMYEMHFAVPMSGAILNTLNIRLDARTISILLHHSSSRIIIVDHEYVPLVRQALELLPRDHKPPLLIPIIEQHDEAYSTSLTYESLLSKGDPNFHWVRPASDWTPMVLNYTSGTTSAPKGVVHCHRALFVSALDGLLEWGVPKQPIYLWTLPMFHSNGWGFPWGVAAQGGTNVCLRHFDAADVYQAIKDHGVTHMCAAPVVLNMLVNDAPPGVPALSSGGVNILTAGAPPAAAVLQRTEVLGFRVSHVYGLTEATGFVVFCAWKRKWDTLPASDRARLKARQGVRMLAVEEMDVLDAATGNSVPRDGTTVGEVVLRGGSVMLGYLKDPEATKRACGGPGGWLFTGDVGVMHPDGYMEIKDRSKDVIISGGENLSSVEVESILYTHPAIKDVAVVARPDEFWGESPCAFVSLKEKHRGRPPSETEIMEFSRQRLPKFMIPKTVVFCPELPRTSTGKIQKFALREAAKAMGPVPAAKTTKLTREIGRSGSLALLSKM